MLALRGGESYGAWGEWPQRRVAALTAWLSCAADTRAFQGVVVRRSGVVALVIRADYAPEHVASAKGQCQRYSAEQDANADSHVTTITAVGKCQLPISSPGSRRLRLICGSLRFLSSRRYLRRHMGGHCPGGRWFMASADTAALPALQPLAQRGGKGRTEAEGDGREVVRGSHGGSSYI